jgi:hypothetical protein
LHQCIRPLIGARCAPGHHGYQRACVLITGQASIGPFGSPGFAGAGKTGPPSRLILSQTSAGKLGYVIDRSGRLSSFVRTGAVPSSRPGTEVATLREHFARADRGHHGARDERPDARDRHQSHAGLILPTARWRRSRGRVRTAMLQTWGLGLHKLAQAVENKWVKYRYGGPGNSRHHRQDQGLVPANHAGCAHWPA